MVQKTVTIYVDDLTGEESSEIATHSFSLNGIHYEIDLAPESYDELADAFARFIEAGRKVGRDRGNKARTSSSEGPSAEEVRAWARVKGIEVSDRGRIPASVHEAYEIAH
ncbi:Lsr2 family protein [Streptomyces sp. NPDC026665]|uniref:histone-like nucleoid-structuring protein Lsr2 n=1 Tax=Streptomyces sp. NPDC026665 TaxID=3154798 RepID=UPI0033F00B28